MHGFSSDYISSAFPAENPAAAHPRHPVPVPIPGREKVIQNAPFHPRPPGGHGPRRSPQMGTEVPAASRVSPHPHPQTFSENLKDSFVPQASLACSLGCFHYPSVGETPAAICPPKSTVDSCRGRLEGWHSASEKSHSFLASPCISPQSERARSRKGKEVEGKRNWNFFLIILSTTNCDGHILFPCLFPNKEILSQPSTTAVD